MVSQYSIVKNINSACLELFIWIPMGKVILKYVLNYSRIKFPSRNVHWNADFEISFYVKFNWVTIVSK